MYIHAFGAYFGLAVARVLWNDKYAEAKGEGVVYHSDIFSMIGMYYWTFTVYLFIYLFILDITMIKKNERCRMKTTITHWLPA